MSHGLGSIPRALPSGDYRGALGKIVRYDMHIRPSRENDRAVFRGLGMTFSGLGATDREICTALMQTAGGLTTAASNAVPRPTRSGGETQSHYESRLREWETATHTASSAGQGVTSASALCNLINESAQTAQGSAQGSSNDWQLMAARAELQRLYAQQQGGGDTMKTVLIVGGLGVAAAAAYFFLFKK